MNKRKITNSIVITHPEIAKEWDYSQNGELNPSDFTAGKHDRVCWKADCGHTWLAAIYHRCAKDKPTGCPYCHNLKVLVGFNDLATLNPQLADEWDYDKNIDTTPYTVTPGSHKKYWWVGNECGHSWEAMIYERNNGTGCPYCHNLKVLVGFNDLAYLEPQIAGEWAYEKNGDLNPTDVTPGTEKYVWWKCSKWHYWRSKISTRTMGTNCPKCNGQQKMKLRLVI